MKASHHAVFPTTKADESGTGGHQAPSGVENGKGSMGKLYCLKGRATPSLLLDLLIENMRRGLPIIILKRRGTDGKRPFGEGNRTAGEDNDITLLHGMAQNSLVWYAYKMTIDQKSDGYK
jgi:hypothetical protein